MILLDVALTLAVVVLYIAHCAARMYHMRELERQERRGNDDAMGG